MLGLDRFLSVAEEHSTIEGRYCVKGCLFLEVLLHNAASQYVFDGEPVSPKEGPFTS